MIFSTSTLSRMLYLYNITRCYGKHVATFAVAVAAGDIIKYQSFVYGSFVWEIHVRYNNIKYQSFVYGSFVLGIHVRYNKEKYAICHKDYRIQSFLSIQYVHGNLCKHLGIDLSTDRMIVFNRYSNLFQYLPHPVYEVTAMCINTSKSTFTFTSVKPLGAAVV